MLKISIKVPISNKEPCIGSCWECKVRSAGNCNFPGAWKDNFPRRSFLKEGASFQKRWLVKTPQTIPFSCCCAVKLFKKIFQENHCHLSSLSSSGLKRLNQSLRQLSSTRLRQLQLSWPEGNSAKKLGGYLTKDAQGRDQRYVVAALCILETAPARVSSVSFPEPTAENIFFLTNSRHYLYWALNLPSLPRHMLSGRRLIA